MSDEIIKLNYGAPIHLDWRNATIYKKCKIYDQKDMCTGYTWHQIVIDHGGVPCTKDKILAAIFRVVDDEEFFPFAYRKGSKHDRFLVRQCKPALDKLFEEQLKIKYASGIFFQLEVQLNIAKYTQQISAIMQIERALSERYKRLITVGNEENILDLSNFSNSAAFADVVVNLSNRSVFKCVIRAISNNEQQLREINGLILSNNNLTTLEPMKLLAGKEFGLIDVQNNELMSGTRLCAELNKIRADELLLNGNPLERKSTYPASLLPILKNFKRINGMPSETLDDGYISINTDVDIDFDGYSISERNYDCLSKFKNSTDWHAISIPDAQAKYTKESILDHFFVTVSEEFEPIYPCYYQYDNGEHQFLVRECYNQLLHLVRDNHMEINVPTGSIKYALKMNLSPYKKGQVNPTDVINKALTKCYNTMVIGGLLDLDNFRNTKGLEHIVINLSSSNVLNRVLVMAARKFMGNCAELRLGHNKILSIKGEKTLKYMSHLIAIDLGNNWIHDLENIKDLSKLGLKSLRLDGNPLCSKYSFAIEYINTVKKEFPNLTKLDNVDISGGTYNAVHKNYVCDLKCYSLIEYFLPAYYDQFDRNDRATLRGFYHESAIFTLTYSYRSEQMESEVYRRHAVYDKYARDILKIPDLKRAYTTVQYGPDEIIRVFLNLPKIRHDMYSFRVDATYYDGDCLIMTVSGVFMDEGAGAMDAALPLAFTRTFVLKLMKKNLGALKCSSLYRIVNDQWNIYKPTNDQLKNSFKCEREFEEDFKKTVKSTADKEAMIIMFKEITALKTIWCSRCLEDEGWNFEKALDRFETLCKNNQIPDQAFT